MQNPQEQLRPLTDTDATRSVDMLWDGIQNRFKQVKASNDGRLNSYKSSITNPATAGSFAVPATDEIKEPGCETGLGHVQAKNIIEQKMPVESGHLSCTEGEISPSLQRRANKIIEDSQRQRQDYLERAAELFLAGPLAWPDYPDFEDIELDDEPMWEPLPPKP